MFHKPASCRTGYGGDVLGRIWHLHHGDNMAMFKGMADNSVDAVVTDPPYLIDFMGRKWDASGSEAAFHGAWSRECLRVLKPGGHLVSFAATRTYHHLACALELAGFEIRDMLVWIFAQGFPKSRDIGKAIDTRLGATRPPKEGATEQARWQSGTQQRESGSWEKQATGYVPTSDVPVTADAATWSGWGTHLKPAQEPMVLARKPVSEGSVEANVLRWGTGAINIDGCRIEGEPIPINRLEQWSGFGQKERPAYVQVVNTKGRWPANVTHDGSDAVLGAFPDAPGQQGALSGNEPSSKAGGAEQVCYGTMNRRHLSTPRQDASSSSRFFFCAKANKHDRAGSKHPTVKPIALMRWLVRLVTPTGGLILDPFGGSGTTGAAAILEGRDVVMAEREAAYVQDIVSRMKGLEK